MPEGLVAELIGEQAGRGANLSPDQIIDAADVAAQLTRHTPEQFRPTAAGIQQIMRIGKVGSKEAGSLFQSAAAAAYPGNPELQARMVQQSIASGIANSPAQDLQTVEEIAEYAAAASQVGGEERGEAVRTAMVALIAQQREFAEGRGPWERSRADGHQVSSQSARPAERTPASSLNTCTRIRNWENGFGTKPTSNGSTKACCATC
jgi:hypothetical protein